MRRTGERGVTGRGRLAWSRVVAALSVVAVATTAARAAGANPPAAGFLFLLVVLFAATWGGLAAGVGASVAAAVCFNFFFLPPTGTFTIAEPQNWTALGVFLVVSGLASHLVTQAREEARRADARVREIEAVNALCVRLLAGAHDRSSLGRAAADALIEAGAASAGILLFRTDSPEVLAWSGAEPRPATIARILSVRATVQAVEIIDDGNRHVLVPLFVGGASIGVLASLRTLATRSAVESVAKVLTIALEREELLRERAHVEALRESEALQTALLRAVSHDLSTPLTAMRFQIDALKRMCAAGEARATVEELDVELARLRRRIEDLLALGRLESGQVAPHAEPVPAADLFRSARESLPLLRRPFTVRVPADCPEILADPSLALEIVVNLLENADRASPEGVSIELVAMAARDGVRLGVLDRGRGIADVPAGREIDAGDVLPRGLGLEIARRFAAANGGSVTLEARSGGGVAAWVVLPAAPLEAPA